MKLHPDDTLYKRLIHSARWRRLRDRVIREHPVCADCGRLAQEVHHIIPPDRYRDDPAELERLMFDPANLVPLCRRCHADRHIMMGKWTAQREAFRRAAADRLDNLLTGWLGLDADKYGGK